LVIGFGNSASLAERCLLDSVIVLVSIGLWTPIVALAETAIQINRFMLVYPADPPLLVTAAMGFSLALLGPGAWSLDARLFGRKRIV
jgi:uncharacterized membrane protein YphA (DoxX/SURF4 family)